jgi:hypothetical protein
LKQPVIDDAAMTAVTAFNRDHIGAEVVAGAR